jgi:hypothetical protein
MKNRRLNILFVAIIALAAAPQALQDAHRFANAAQERVEDEFWSVFLSSQMPEANASRQMDSPQRQLAPAELVADAGASASQNCPLERVVENVEAVASAYKATAESQARPSRAVRRAAEKAQAESAEPQEAMVDDRQQVASLDAVRRVEFTEKERSALEAARLHSREAEKAADVASKASAFASFADDDEGLQIKIKQTMDKQMRVRTRYMMDVPGQGLPAPNPTRSM